MKRGRPKKYRDALDKRLAQVRRNAVVRNQFVDGVRELLGSVCVKCGYSDERALDVDHVHNNGSKNKRVHQQALLKLIQANPQDYQRLCRNCNWIKYIEHRKQNIFSPRRRGATKTTQIEVALSGEDADLFIEPPIPIS